MERTNSNYLLDHNKQNCSYSSGSPMSHLLSLYPEFSCSFSKSEVIEVICVHPELPPIHWNLL